jgi:hypothetical protein
VENVILPTHQRKRQFGQEITNSLNNVGIKRKFVYDAAAAAADDDLYWSRREHNKENSEANCLRGQSSPPDGDDYDKVFKKLKPAENDLNKSVSTRDFSFKYDDNAADDDDDDVTSSSVADFSFKYPTTYDHDEDHPSKGLSSLSSNTSKVSSDNLEEQIEPESESSTSTIRQETDSADENINERSSNEIICDIENRDKLIDEANARVHLEIEQEEQAEILDKTKNDQDTERKEESLPATINDPNNNVILKPTANMEPESEDDSDDDSDSQLSQDQEVQEKIEIRAVMYKGYNLSSIEIEDIENPELDFAFKAAKVIFEKIELSKGIFIAANGKNLSKKRLPLDKNKTSILKDAISAKFSTPRKPCVIESTWKDIRAELNQKISKQK